AANDRPRPDPERAPGTLETRHDGIDRLFHGELPPRVERGTVTDLHVADLLRVRVLGQLERRPFEGIGLLKDLDREIEGLEVPGEADARGQTSEKAPEIRRARDPGQTDSLLPRELEERRGAQRSIEMDVKVGLGKRVEESPAAPGITPRRRPPSSRRVAHP